ncbi:MAG: bifunctional UDP-sugar hydrolase/5'-nucleotidase [Bryobacteraceae bacterium]
MRLLRTVLLGFIGVVSICAREVKIVVLATTDLHGNVYPYDYLTGQAVPRGLAKIATLIKAERSANPATILVDCGDTIQGASLEGVYQHYVRTGTYPLGLKPERPLTADPMMLAMNHLGYDAMAVGNHEYNYGLQNLDKARSAARFPWLSANTKVAPEAGRSAFEAYTVKVVNGIKIGIIGITTPAVPSWEKPENYKHYTFIDAKEAVLGAVAELKSKHKPDLIIVAAHAGLDRDLRTGAVHGGESAKENMIYAVASGVPGVDAIVFGHTHRELEEANINGVLLTQPKNWGISLARIEFIFDVSEAGSKLLRKSSKLLPVTAATVADQEVLKIAKPYHDLAEAYLNTRVTQSSADLNASESRIEDTAMIDAIHQVQLHFGKADVSFASSFNPRAAIAKGPVTVRQIAALYLYDNELYAIEGNGKMIREALENAARFYNSCRTRAALPEPPSTGA